MAIIKFRPMTPGTRGMSKLDYAELTTAKPEKSLLTTLVPKPAATTKES